MRVIGELNKISDKLKSEIPKLKQGQAVSFQMLTGQINPEPDERERSKTPMLYPITEVPMLDRIYDPYINGGAGGYVDIGVPKSWVKTATGDYDIIYEFFVPGAGGAVNFSGKFTLVGGRISDEEKFEYFWLTNYNSKNPHRDTSVKPLFHMIDVVEDAKQMNKTSDALREAINYAHDMEIDEARNISAALNWPYITEQEVLMAKLKDFATKFPEAFLRTAQSPKTKTKALIKNALDKKIINYDVIGNKVTMGQEVLASLFLRDGEDFLTAMSDWCNTATNGKEVLENIKNQLEEKNQPFVETETKKRGRKPKEELA